MTDKLYVDTIEPEGATTNLTIGQSGQDIIVTGNDIRANVVQDAGGKCVKLLVELKEGPVFELPQGLDDKRRQAETLEDLLLVV